MLFLLYISDRSFLLYIFFLPKLRKQLAGKFLRQCLIIDISGEPQDSITQLFNFIGTKNNTIVEEMCPQKNVLMKRVYHTACLIRKARILIFVALLLGLLIKENAGVSV